MKEFEMSTQNNVSPQDVLSPKCISVKKVRDDVKNAIDKMGSPAPISYRAMNNDTDNDTSMSSQDMLSAIVQIRKITSMDDKSPLQSAREDSQMTVYNISELSDNYVAPNAEAVVKTSVYTSSNHQISVCPYRKNCQDNIIKHAPFERSLAQTSKIIKQAAIDRTSRLASFLGIKCNKETCHGQCDLYKINIEQPRNDSSPPRRLVFDLMDDVPKTQTKTIGTNTKNKNLEEFITQNNENVIEEINTSTKTNNRDLNKNRPSEKVDIYYFDHGNPEYFRTTDLTPVIKTEFLAERTEYYTKRFWAQIFGTIHIGVSFVTSFILQLIRFLLQAIVRPLTVGIVQIFSDYFIKPCLAVLFNGIVQPPLIFLFNVATSIRDLCEPIATGIGYFIREISVMFKAIRLVQVDTNRNPRHCPHATVS